MDDMDDEHDFRRRRRLRPRSGSSYNEQWILRYLAHRTSLSHSDICGRDSLIDVYLGKERAPVVLDRLRRKGQVRRSWSRGQWHYALHPGAHFAPLIPIIDHADLALRGIPLTRAEIEKMERQTALRPRSMRLRSVLIDNYDFVVNPDRKSSRRYRDHIIFLIEKAPGHRQLGFRAMRCLDQNPDAQASAAIARLWHAQVQANPGNLSVLKNAIDFFWYSNSSDAVPLLEAALAIEERPEWRTRLRQERASRVFAADGMPDEVQAAFVLAEFEKAWDLADEHEQSDAAEIAQLAFAAGQTDKARQFAQWVLDTPDSDSDEARGDETAFHEASITLGRIALREGDRAGAGAYLLASVDVATSSELAYGMIQMSLARELLGVGEREVVLRYLGRCSRLSKSLHTQIPEWIQAIERGVMPNFGDYAKR